MYFYTFFYSYLFPQMFSNNNFQFLNTCTKQALSIRLKVLKSTCVYVSIFFFFFFEKGVCYTARKESKIMLFQLISCIIHRTCMYFTHTTTKKNFETRSYSTIHTFKNYFVTIFSVISKINDIQIDFKKNINF